MFPYERKEYYTTEELFPDLCIPLYRVRIQFYLWKRFPLSDQMPTITFSCACRQPYNLLCLSFAQVALNQWVEDVNNYLLSESARDPYPHHAIKDATVWRFYPNPMPDEWTGEWELKIVSPLWGLNFLINKQCGIEHYTLSKIYEGYRLVLRTDHFTFRVKNAVQQIMETYEKFFTFNFLIEVYPHYKFGNRYRE